MRTFRNCAFLAMMLTVVIIRDESAFALSLPEFECPSGCLCTEDYNEVAVYCENEDAVYVCPEIEDACVAYCAAYEYYLIVDLEITTASCEYLGLNGDGCWPHALDPPINETCNCLCWY